MAKKRVIVEETATVAPPARVAKPKTPRVKAAQHSKAVSTPFVITHVGEVTHTGEVTHVAENTRVDSAHEVIARIAYSFWEARGRQDGAELEDWVRAEREYTQRSAGTCL